ncbi:MAG: T9SS type A sorting domain-containing protein [Bacteroidetes bacterium]|nr:T9SS type A sorting domain-containing protein [Bacteroidota bacterium]
MQFKFTLLLLLVSLFSCTQVSNKSPFVLEQEVEDLEQEWEKTRDPKTGRVESLRLWKYLLNQKSFLGAGGFNKARFYPNSWSAVDDFFANLSVQRIVYDPRNPLTMYFCTGEGWNNADAARGAGVWKSVNGGETWIQLSSTLNDSFSYCHDMLVHPLTSDIYVATRVGGLMRSEDGGNSWMQVLGAGNGSKYNTTTDIELTADNELVVCIGNFNTDGIYFSANGDAGSWEQRMNGFPHSIRRVELATAPSNANYMYAIPTSSSTSDSNRIVGVYKSVDKGMSWTSVSLPGGDKNFAKIQGWYDLIIKVDPNDEKVLLVGGLNVYRSRDAGDSWQQLFEGQKNVKTTLPYVHVDQHEIVFKNSDTVMFGNDGGIYMSPDMLADTPSFVNLNDNYNVTQFYSCARENVSGSQRIIGGAQDNGSLGSTANGISPFDQLSWADGSYCNINHKDPEIYFTTTQYQRVYRFNHGNIDTIANRKLNKDNTEFINPIEIDPNNPEILYQLSGIGLWRMDHASTDSRTGWIQCSRAFGSFTAIGISTNVANTVFIGRNSGGRIYRIDNATQTDETYFPVSADPTGSLPSAAYCNCIYVDPKDANHVISVYSNYGVESVWESKNALDATPIWKSQEGDLPDIPVRWAALHPKNPAVCYIATEAGVMMTNNLNDSNTKWVSVNTGLANLKVNMIRLRESDMSLVAATHGRGMFTGKIQADYTVKWEERGPMNVGGRTRTILFDPNDPSGKKLWAGSVSGGLWVVRNFDSIPHYEEVVASEFKVFVGANPIQGNLLSVFIESDRAELVELEIYNVSGQLIFERSVNSVVGKLDEQLDVTMLRSGIYFLRVHYRKKYKTIRLLKL